MKTVRRFLDRLYIFPLMALMTLFTPGGFAQNDDVILIDVSYKVVLDPTTGLRPPLAGVPVTDAQIDQAIADMNTLMSLFQRGYRFRRIDPITDVGGLGNTGPSSWYDTDFFANNGHALKNQMESAAESDPAYAWNLNAINLYITNGICGGICSFPGEDIIIIGGCSGDDGAVQLHEIGHFFDRCHTQGCPCGCCDPPNIGECNTVPGDDEIADTLPDLACWDQNGISNWSYATNYANLTTTQQQLVDDVFFNIMSYHFSACGQGIVPFQLTELQLNQWTDAANTLRSAVVDGETVFIDNGPCLPLGDGSSTSPYCLSIGLAIAGAEDVALLFPGAYDQTPTFDTRLTLRTSRAGSAVIGTSALPTSSTTPRSSEDTLLELRRIIPSLRKDPIGVRIAFPGESSQRGPQ